MVAYLLRTMCPMVPSEKSTTNERTNMTEMKITTNNNWRSFKYRDEVPADVLASEFDWTNEGNAKDGDYSDGFIKYRNCWYHTSMFMRTSLDGWDGAHGDSFFSGVLLKLSDDGEEYRIATYTS